MCVLKTISIGARIIILNPAHNQPLKLHPINHNLPHNRQSPLLRRLHKIKIKHPKFHHPIFHACAILCVVCGRVFAAQSELEQLECYQEVFVYYKINL